jgi:hypothetical protein
MSLLASNTPPNSLGLLPIVILNDKQAREIVNTIATIKIVPTILSSYLPSSKTLLRNPLPSLITVTFSHVMLLLSVGGVTRQYYVFSYVLPHLPSSSPLWFSIVVIEAVLPWSS